MSGETYGVHPPLTRETVSQAERELGVRLPADYLALLRVQNGGRASDDCDGFVVDPPGPRGETYIGLVDMDGLGGPGFHMDLERSERRHDPDYGPPEGLVLIGSADDTELVSDFELAPTCRAFVEGLRPLASIPGAVPTRDEPDAVMARRWPVRLLRRLRR